jgi:putative membrane protein
MTKQEELDVDIRFLLSNERTLLAWVRTSLTIQAGGIALAAWNHNGPLLGLVIIVFGVAVAVMGYLRYKEADRSIREGHLPPVGNWAALQVYGIVIIAVFLAVLQVTIFR